jgi:hypothetical protein
VGGVKVRHPNSARWFDGVEEAQLRRAVYRAFALQRKLSYAEAIEAIEAIETWQAETAPERLERHAREGDE